jgi:hypothetical protein
VLSMASMSRDSSTGNRENKRQGKARDPGDCRGTAGDREVIIVLTVPLFETVLPNRYLVLGLKQRNPSPGISAWSCLANLTLLGAAGCPYIRALRSQEGGVQAAPGRLSLTLREAASERPFRRWKREGAQGLWRTPQKATVMLTPSFCWPKGVPHCRGVPWEWATCMLSMRTLSPPGPN